MLMNILSGIVCITTLLVCGMQFLSLKKEKAKLLIIYSILLIFIRSLFPIREIVNINMFFSIIIYTTIPFIFFNGNKIGKIVYIITYYILSALCEIITMSIFSIFFCDAVLTNDTAFILGLIVTNIVLIVIMYICSLYWKTLKLKNIPRSSWLLLSLPITTVVLIINVNDFIKAMINIDVFFAIFLGLLFSNIACIYIYYKTVITISKEKELIETLDKTKLEYEAASDLLAQHNIFLHDIRNHSKEMLDLLKCERYDELENYINDVYGESTNTFNMINTNFKILDVLINDRIYIIKTNNILLRTKLESINFNSINMIDIENIFKFFVDLGIQECIKSNFEQPYLYIKSKQIKEQTIVTFKFSSISANIDERVNQEINSILEKYNAYHLVETNANDSEVNITIVFLKSNK